MPGSPRLSIAICGAGPAGLACALALGRAGHTITIFEQFDEAKPVGSGLILQPTGLAVLDWLGLGVRMRALGARIDRLHGTAAGRTVLDVRYAALGDARGLAVHRAGLFNVLHDAVLAAGIIPVTNRKIVGLEKGQLHFESGDRQGPFDLVIDAMGSRSLLLPLASAPQSRRALAYGAIWASLPWQADGFDPHALEQRYRNASQMCGVLPIGRMREGEEAQAAFFWSLKHQDYEAWRERGLERWKEDVLQLWPETVPLLASIKSENQMTLARYEHRTLPLPFGTGLVFVGDSAHSTSPQLGQGANMALLDCHALTQALATHQTIPEAVAAYAAARRWHVRLFQAMSFMFTPFYQSDSLLLPFVRDRVVAHLSRLPPAQRFLATLVSGRLGLKPLV
ncbi:FAD-dependent oxidoreductase [Aestuariivirga litoralis]|uniref:FAD-dependent oxidoreductase n=1 Tax=Aestuariivirga litoralis TaxID=2650924 RepID=UPI0018C747C3|nr:NAD(P)/FAD-dependent oxidoreductase [Aestuariivirga litoralis]MBG1231371.1 FAD-dependent monooxygenase [Aestuariivirga litoralis]